jgi:diguanylate cyclase (GGDEF)-like protein
LDHPFLLDALVGAVSASIVAVVLVVVERVASKPAARPEYPPAERAIQDSLVDPATGLVSRLAWQDIVHREDDRFTRYDRPMTVLVAELDGLDSLAASFGPGLADRLVPSVALAFLRNARAADVFARTEHARLVGLLPETDEVAATNYIERVRAECDAWLEAGALAVRLAIGWAQPRPGQHLADALRTAEERMNAERRRSAFRAPQSPGRPSVASDEPWPPTAVGIQPRSQARW